MTIGVVMIQFLFKKLDVFSDIDFLVTEENIPTFMFMKDMVDNGFDISVQDRYVSFGEKRHPLILENYFPTYRWTPQDLPNAVYAEQELRTLHRPFGHPSLRALRNLIQCAE